MRRSDTDVIIIGAGISGLACAKTLLKEDLRFLIPFEDHRIYGVPRSLDGSQVRSSGLMVVAQQSKLADDKRLE